MTKTHEANPTPDAVAASPASSDQAHHLSPVLQAKLRQIHPHDAAALAELLAHHPHEAEQILAMAAHVLGNSTVQHALKLEHHAPGVPGGKLNVDIDHLNKKHAGSDTARLGHHDKSDHNAFRTVHAAQVFDNDGNPIGPVLPPHTPVKINAGTITKLICRDPADPHPKPVDCVFVFQAMDDAGAHQISTTGGWMKASDLPGAVKTDQREIAKSIAHERDDAHQRFSAGIPILPESDWKSDPRRGLRTYPPPKQVGNENETTDYYNNLCLNLPRSGGKRFGVETTRLTPDSVFYPHTPAERVTIPLFATGSETPVPGMHLTFVYGYTEDDAGAKIYGWINTAMLPPGTV